MPGGQNEDVSYLAYFSYFDSTQWEVQQLHAGSEDCTASRQAPCQGYKAALALSGDMLVLECADAWKPHWCGLLILPVGCCTAGLLEHPFLYKSGDLHLHYCAVNNQKSHRQQAA